MRETQKVYPILWWRPIFDIGLCYAFISVAIVLSIRWPMYSVLFALITANRQLALSLICHEALHGNVSANKKVNQFLGRWFCGFPTGVSFSKYKKLHILHHAGLGTKMDPDVHLYQNYPISKYAYFRQQFLALIQLKTLIRFLSYYTDLLEIAKLRFNKNSVVVFKKWKQSDFFEFILFQILLVLTLTYFDFWTEYLLFYILPLILIVQPYVWIMGGLQHGPIPDHNDIDLKSRTILGSKWLMETLLPLNINYHGAHHFNPSIPHYWLSKYSEDLQKNGKSFLTRSYSSSVKELFN